MQYYQEAALRGAFKQSVLTLWVRVPVKHSSDAHGRGLNNFVPAVSREIKRHGMDEVCRRHFSGLGEQLG